MEIDRAEAIAKVAQVIVNSATLEVKFINAVGGKGTGFIKDTHQLPAPAGSEKPAAAAGKTTVHKIR